MGKRLLQMKHYLFAGALLGCVLFAFGGANAAAKEDESKAECFTIDISDQLYSKGGFAVTEEEADGEADARDRYLAGEENIALVRSRILTAIESRSFAWIDIADANILAGDGGAHIGAVVRDYLNEHPEWFYISGSFTYWSSGGYVTDICLTACKNYEAMSVELNRKVDEILAMLDPGWSDTDKLLFVHDYLAAHISYAYQDYLDAVENKAANGGKIVLTMPNVYDSYGALVNGVCVCQGYSEAYKLLLDRLGIPCEIVTSESMNHAWNAVQLNGNWYHVDITWDDPTWNRQGRVRHNHFLASDAEMQDSLKHYGWVSGRTCSDDTYRTYWWDDAETQIVLLNGKYYFWTKESSAYFNLMERNGELQNSILRIGSLKLPASEPGYFYPIYPSLSYMNGQLYYNDLSQVFHYDLSTGISTPVYVSSQGADQYMIGMHVYENGQIRMTFTVAAVPNPSNDNYITGCLRPGAPVITIDGGAVNTDTTMEYSLNNGIDWTDCTANMACTAFGTGTQEVKVLFRVKAKTGILAGDSATVLLFAGMHVAQADDGDCTTAILCTVCGETTTAAKTHIMGTDDGNCTTAVLCGNTGCTHVMVTAKSHVPGADDGNCTTAVLCKNEGCTQIATPAKSHVAKADDGDCTTAVYCNNTGCTQIVVAAQSHVAGDDDGNCMTDIMCVHEGCTKAAVKGTNGHKPGEDDRDCTTAVKCTNEGCTKDAIEAKTAHVAADDDNNCSTAVYCKNPYCGVILVAAKEHSPEADDGDCTTAVKCRNTGCTYIWTPAMPAHVAAKDDGDCTTAVKCKYEGCNHIMVAAEAGHVADEDDGNCKTAVTCKNNGCKQIMVAAKINHEAGVDDGDCTTPVLCTNPGCRQVTLAALEAHEANLDDGDCTTAITCKNFGCTHIMVAAKSHEAAEDDGTCLTAVYCKNSGCAQLMIPAQSSHIGGSDDGDCTTAVLCTRTGCNVAVVAAQSHVAPVDDGDCTTAEYCLNSGCTKIAREAFAGHEAAEDDGDCSSALTCKHANCTYTYLIAKSHAVGADDGDCTTPILCSNEGCTQIAQAGELSHTPDLDDGNCLTSVACTHPGCTQAAIPANVAHTPREDDGLCTTAVYCSIPGCNQVAVTAYPNHLAEADDGDCTTPVRCMNPGCTEEIVRGYANHGAGYDDGDCTTPIACCNEGCTKNAVPAKTHVPAYAIDCNQTTPCANEGCIYRFPAEDHIWDAGAVTLEPTEDREGVRTYTCVKNPAHTRTEAIDKLPATPKEGLVKAEDGSFILYENGAPATHKFGFAMVEGVKFLIVNGKYENSISGLYNDPENPEDWYFLAEGRAQTQHTGLVSYDGAWFYVSEGKMDSTIGGFVEYDGGLFFVAVGRIITECNGLAQDPNHPTDWYYLANGQAQTQYTGLAQYDGAWFYVINGKLANDYTGWVNYNGASFYVQQGMLK